MTDCFNAHMHSINCYFTFADHFMNRGRIHVMIFSQINTQFVEHTQINIEHLMFMLIS